MAQHQQEAHRPLADVNREHVGRVYEALAAAKALVDELEEECTSAW